LKGVFEMKATLNVKGMSCSHCEQAVKGALAELSGVSEVNVDVKTGKVEAAYDADLVTVDTIKEAIEEQGYDVAE